MRGLVCGLKNLKNVQGLVRTSSRTKFLVATEVKESPIPGAGDGNFAAQDIPCNAVIWAYDDQNCSILTAETAGQESPERLGTILWKGFMTKDLQKFVVLEDGAQFTNHGEPANMRWGPGETWVAAHPIKAGEELTFDYSEFGLNLDTPWLRPLCEKFCPKAIAYEAVRTGRGGVQA